MKKITKKGVAGLVAIAASVTIVSALAIGTVGYLSTQVNNASKNEISNIMDTLTTVAEDNRNGEIDLVNPPESVPEIPIENGNEYIMLYDQSTSFVLGEENIDILNNGEIIASLPSSEFEKEDNNLTISGLGAPYDGTYVFYDDGYVELNETIVAKSKNKWLTIPEGNYLIVHKNDVWFSMDGNIPLEILFDQQTLYNALTLINENIDENGKAQTEYPYTFSKFDGETITLKNVYDILAMQNIQEKGHGLYFAVCAAYDYWGATAQDFIAGNDMVTNAYWNDVKGVLTKNVVKVYNNSKIPMSLNESIDGKVVELTENIKYYWKGQETKNIFICEDWVFAFEEGMTYRDWIDNTSFSAKSMIPGWSTGDHNGLIYIPEEYLDRYCEPGEFIPGGGMNPIYFENIYGLYADSSYIYYSEGDVTFVHPQPNNGDKYIEDNHYTYQGLWYGFSEKVITDKAKSYDLYNYYLRNGYTVTGHMFGAFKKNSSAETIDISQYLKYTKTYSNRKIDFEALETELGIPASVTKYLVTKDNGNLILLNSSSSTKKYLNCDTQRDAIFNNCALGITFYYNGNYYEGWF